ncbi:MAG: glucosyltransferase domain-containing protein [Clostridia bacterium]|nr:glucosyltransferase domain-containing protein [Clostridia bacterium]
MDDRPLTNKEPGYLSGIVRDVLAYLRRPAFLVPYLLCLIGAYGFFLTHYSVSVDDLEGPYYYTTGLLAQGRLSATLFHRLFGMVRNNTYLPDLIGILLLALAGVLFCVLLDRVVHTSSRVPQLVFACLFVTYPLHSELFSYGGTSIAIGAGCLFVGLSLLYVLRYRQTRRWADLVRAGLWLLPACSWYESVLLIYVGFVFALLLLEQFSDDPPSFRRFLIDGCVCAATLAAAFVCEFLLSRLVMLVCGVSASHIASNGIGWRMESFSDFLGQLGWLLLCDFRDMVLTGLWYYPITEMGLTILSLPVLAVVHTVKKKSAAVACAYLGLWLTPGLLGFLQGYSTAYRSCQAYAFLVSFYAFFLLWRLSFAGGRRVAYRVFCGLFCLCTVWQLSSINHCFVNDWRRYEYEKYVVQEIGATLHRDYGVSKETPRTVVFVGSLPMSEDVKRNAYVRLDDWRAQALRKMPLMDRYFETFSDDGTYFLKPQQGGCQSYINWSIHAFDRVNDCTIRFFEWCGVDGIEQGTWEQYEEACAYADEHMPGWPSPYSIVDHGDYIVVNFGFEPYIGN